MMPEDGMSQLRDHDAIFLGAVGYPGVPDHVSLWGLLIPIRREFDQYVNLRPVRLLPGITPPLRDRKQGDIDMWIVRENTEGEYSQIGGRLHAGTEHETVIQEAIFTRRGTDRILRYAFELAQRLGRDHVTSATKSNGIFHSMPFWGRALRGHEQSISSYPRRPISHRHSRRPLCHVAGAIQRGGGQQPFR